ncbi:MAG: GspH/FimT family pseudopilin [Janthinobacterium lividum]
MHGSRHGFRHGFKHGFTLVEMMVVIVIVAILSAVSMPSFRALAQTYPAQALASSFRAALEYARAEAIKQGIPVTLCVSSNGATCNGSTAWQNGWIIFADANADKTVGALLQWQKALAGTDTMVADNSVSALSFSRDGFVIALPGSGDVTFTIHSTPANSSATRCVAVTKTGHLVTQRAGTGACA